MRTLESLAHDFDSISLAELVSVAGLLTRTDRKYLLNYSEAIEVLSGLPAGYRVLAEGIDRQFDYESIYFDTPDLLSYRLAACGRPKRFKLRTRAYLDSNLAFLEVKTKGSRRETIKQRLEYEPDNRSSLNSDGRDFASETLAEFGIGGESIETLTSVLTTSYRRMTFLQPDGKSRATMDTELEWHDNAGNALKLTDLVILETKSADHASSIDHLLWTHGYRPQSVSKYATGLAALHPELPANRWSRQLRQYFSSTTPQHLNEVAA